MAETTVLEGVPRSRAAPRVLDRDLDLDVIRGLAILLAMGWHIAGPPTGIALLDALMAPVRAFGWAGVDLFFVLSGFLVGRLVFGEHKKTGGFRSGRFLVRRAFKLWPVLYTFLAAELVLSGKPWQAFLFQNLFHVQNYTPNALNHLWSLAVEEHFYLIFALAFPLAVRRGFRPERAAMLLAAILVCALLFRAIGVWSGAQPVEVQTRTHFRADALACGVLLALTSIYHPDIFRRVLKWRPLWWLAAVLGAVFLSVVHKQTPLGETLGYSVSYLSAAALLLAVREAAWVGRFAPALRPMQQLGLYSYAIYLWHISAAKLVTMAAARLGFDLGAVPMLALRYVAAVAVAVGMTRLIEWPFLRMRDRLFPSRSPLETAVPG